MTRTSPTLQKLLHQLSNWNAEAPPFTLYRRIIRTAKSESNADLMVSTFLKYQQESPKQALKESSSVIRLCMKEKRYNLFVDKLLPFVNVKTSNGLSTTIRAFRATKQWQNGLNLLMYVRKSEYRNILQPYNYRDVIWSCRYAPEDISFKISCDLIRYNIQDNVPLDPLALNTLVQTAKKKDIDDLLNILEETWPFIVNWIKEDFCVNFLRQTKNLEVAFSLMHKLRKLSPMQDPVQLLNAFIDKAAKDGDKNMAVSVIKEVKLYFPQYLSQIKSPRLVQLLTNTEDPNWSVQLYENYDMVRSSIDILQHIYVQSMTSGNYEQALEILEESIPRNDLCIKAYTHMICNSQKNKMTMSAALELYQRLVNANVIPDNALLAGLVKGCRRNEMLFEAIEILKKSDSETLRQVRHLQILLELIPVFAIDPQQNAAQMLTVLNDLYEFGVKISPSVYEPVFHQIIRLKDEISALRLCSLSLKWNRNKYDPDVFATAIKLCSLNGLNESCHKVFDLFDGEVNQRFFLNSLKFLDHDASYEKVIRFLKSHINMITLRDTRRIQNILSSSVKTISAEVWDDFTTLLLYILHHEKKKFNRHFFHAFTKRALELSETAPTKSEIQLYKYLITSESINELEMTNIFRRTLRHNEDEILEMFTHNDNIDQSKLKSIVLEECCDYPNGSLTVANALKNENQSDSEWIQELQLRFQKHGQL